MKKNISDFCLFDVFSLRITYILTDILFYDFKSLRFVDVQYKDTKHEIKIKYGTVKPG